jgi:hypothetical protein
VRTAQPDSAACPPLIGRCSEMHDIIIVCFVCFWNSPLIGCRLSSCYGRVIVTCSSATVSEAASRHRHFEE